MKKRVVITGIGIVTSLGRGIEVTAEALKHSKAGIGPIMSFDTLRQKNNQGGEVSPSILQCDLCKDSKLPLDRSSQLLTLSAYDALQSAKLFSKGKPLEASTILGTTLGGMLSVQKYHRALLNKEDTKPHRIIVQDGLPCHQPFHLAPRMNILGEAVVINNACASGLSAIGLACDRVRMGSTEISLAGGYDALSDFTYAGFNVLQLITSDMCRPFDRLRSGLILGEGAGVVVLEEMSHAVKRKAQIYAEIIGFGQTSDAYHITKPDPEAKGASTAISMAMEEAGITPQDIDYVNAHGTGTPSNDVMEAKALHQSLGEYAKKVPVSSTKPFMGHLLGAAGAVEVIISVIAMQKNVIPENLNSQTADPDCDLNIVTGHSKEAQVNTVLSNSFGFGGSNAAMLLRKVS